MPTMPILQRLRRLLNATGMLLVLLSAGLGIPPAKAQILEFTAAKVGPPFSGAAAELYQPAGAGPFPAVVVLHGRNGVAPHHRAWARRLAEWGYVALLIDSFRPRAFFAARLMRP